MAIGIRYTKTKNKNHFISLSLRLLYSFSPHEQGGVQHMVICFCLTKGYLIVTSRACWISYSPARSSSL